jgi:large subunit ribosomal protein L10
MPTEEKIKFVQELEQKIKENSDFIVTDYRGLTVEQITDLRNKLREKGVYYQVVKNNLVKIALKNNNIEGLDEYFFGPSAVAFAKDDPVSPSKILSDFAKKQKALKIKGGYSDGKVITDNDITELAKLPSKEVLIGKLLGSLKSPASGIVNVLNGPIRNLVYALKEISKQKS